MIDITALAAAEAELRNERQIALDANRAKSEFLAGMSHEFRTPLNAIIGFSEMLELEVLGPLGNEKYKEYVNDIGVSGRHLLKLVNDVLDVAKIEAQKAELYESEIDVDALIRETGLFNEQQALADGIDLVIDVAPEMPRLNADETRIRQVVINLVNKW